MVDYYHSEGSIGNKCTTPSPPKLTLIYSSLEMLESAASTRLGSTVILSLVLKASLETGQWGLILVYHWSIWYKKLSLYLTIFYWRGQWPEHGLEGSYAEARPHPGHSQHSSDRHNHKTIGDDDNTNPHNRLTMNPIGDPVLDAQMVEKEEMARRRKHYTNSAVWTSTLAEVWQPVSQYHYTMY